MVLDRDGLNLFVESKVAVGWEALRVADFPAALAGDEIVPEGLRDEHRAWS